MATPVRRPKRAPENKADERKKPVPSGGQEGEPSASDSPGAPVRAEAGGNGTAVRDLVGVKPSPLGEPAFGRAAPPPEGAIDLPIKVELVSGCITQVESPVAVVGYYKATPPSGAVKLFDDALGGWISHAIDLGMVGADLGELFFIPIDGKNLPARALILAGMGEAGAFKRDDLRYLMTNVTYAVRAHGHGEFSTVVIGSGAGAIPKDRALRAMIEGTGDALQRFPGAEPRTIRIKIVEFDANEFRKIRAILDDMKDGKILPSLTLEVTTAPSVEWAPAPAPGKPLAADLPANERVIRITITRHASEDGEPTSVEVTDSAPPVFVLEYSALAETAVIPVRDVPVQAYFAARLPERLKKAASRASQETYGKLLANYLLPEDFRRLIEEGNSLTLVLDSSTATIPWEMAGFKSQRGMSLFGPDLKLTRQFRTQRAANPGIAPPINAILKVLVIADPAPPPYDLPGARREGLGVVEVMKTVKDVWNDRIDLDVVARIGSSVNPSSALREDLRRIGGYRDVVVSADVCDPLEILALLLNEHFDVVHYAGHGVFDPGGWRRGWVFDADCILTAQEIFKVRQVPRLVFANACHSAEIEEQRLPGLADVFGAVHDLRQQAGLAEAFFERGIPNYMGAGWAVDDAQALRFATLFYRQVLGVAVEDGEPEKIFTAPPATFGDSLAHARRDLLERGDSTHCGTTWGAYQHYGQVGAKLLPFQNKDEGR